MQQVASCPSCDARLALPSPTVAADGSLAAVCPVCSHTFPLTLDRLTFLPVVQLAEASMPAKSGVRAEPQAKEVQAAEAQAAESPIEGDAKFEPVEPQPMTPAPESSAIDSSTNSPTDEVSPIDDKPSVDDTPPASSAPPEQSQLTLAELLDRRPTISKEPSPPVEPSPVVEPPLAAEISPAAETSQDKTTVAEQMPSLATLLGKANLGIGNRDNPGEEVAEELPSLANTPDQEFKLAPDASQETEGNKPFGLEDGHHKSAEQTASNGIAPPSAEKVADSEPFEKDFSFDLEAASPNLSFEDAAEPELTEPIGNATTAPSTSLWKQGALIGTGGLAGVTVGIYLLSLLGVFGSSTPDTLAQTPTAPPSLLDDGVSRDSKPLPEPTASREEVVRASFEQPAAATRGALSRHLWDWLADSPRFGVEELNAALDGADNAAATLTEYQLTDTDGLQQLGAGYATLCELAQTLSLLDVDSSHPDMMIRRLEAVDAYRQLFRSAHVRADTRQIATRWIKWAGRPHGGVFFAGVPTGPHKIAGEGLYEYQFQFEDGELVTLVSPEPFKLRRFEKAAEMLIIGCVIESPQERIPGYKGDAERVVWRATSVALATPDFP